MKEIIHTKWPENLNFSVNSAYFREVTFSKAFFRQIHRQWNVDTHSIKLTHIIGAFMNYAGFC